MKVPRIETFLILTPVKDAEQHQDTYFEGSIARP